MDQILVVDDDNDFLASLPRECDGLTPIKAIDLVSACEILLNGELKLRAIFISTLIPNYNWVEIILKCHEQRPGVPLFLTRFDPSKLPEIDAGMIKDLGVRKSLGIELDFPKMVSEVAGMLSGFNKELALQQADDRQTGAVVPLDQYEQLKAINAKNYLAGSESLFDIYIKLGSKGFIKILKAGQTFDVERLEKYLKKGVESLYVPKAAFEPYVAYCKHLTQRIIESKLISKNVKVAQTLNFGDQVYGFLKKIDLAESEIAYARDFVSSVESLFERFNPRKSELLNAFLNDLIMYEHGIGTVMISSLMARAMGMSTDYAVETIGLAALLHDIGLINECEAVRSEDMNIMNNEQREIFQRHPGTGVKKLKDVTGIQEVILQAIEHHHVRKGSQGFPMVVNHMETNPVAQIVGFSSDFLHAIEKSQRFQNVDPFQYIEREIIPGFSMKIERSYLRCFMRK